MKIDADTTIEELVRTHPKLVSVLERFGIVCIACGEPVWGTLGEHVREKGLDMDEVLDAVNRAIGGLDD
ncbi:MAG TPA: DUF1858 domain-containing protein [Proteobacteria bacterium]|nr:DUF1858 domain-containing protein [Pseudomonadota bacterium]